MTISVVRIRRCLQLGEQWRNGRLAPELRRAAKRLRLEWIVRPGSVLAAAATTLMARPFDPESGIDTHGKVAGDENGLVASTTCITSMCRSVDPLLEFCTGVSVPLPTAD